VLAFHAVGGALSSACASTGPPPAAGVYASHQVVTALAMGALYAAPYVGRMTDAGKNVRPAGCPWRGVAALPSPGWWAWGAHGLEAA
jgi:hypothetical protein